MGLRRGRPVRARLGRLLALAALLTTAVVPASAAAAVATGPCGALAYPDQPPAYRHVVVIMDENLGYDDFQEAADAPYLHALQAACGAETNMHAATHPSQPNYMAATSGVASAAGVHTAANNVFHQVQANGGTWRVYAESMPKPCSASTSAVPMYKAGHNPAFWYTDLRSPTNTCLTSDLPIAALQTDLAADRLPTYAWITPDLCGDMHWAAACPFPKAGRVAAGDAWMATWVAAITATPSYQRGETLLLVTFDEGTEAGKDTFGVDCTDPAYYPTHPDCHIATIVVSPYVVPGSTDASAQSLYSLLATTEDALGLARLGRAAGQGTMRAGLRF